MSAADELPQLRDRASSIRPSWRRCTWSTARSCGGFCSASLRDAQLTSDVLQATFVKMVQRGHETQEASRKAWLFRVAYHEAMAYRRREGVGDKVLRRIAADAQRGTPTARPARPMSRCLRLESVQVGPRGSGDFRPSNAKSCGCEFTRKRPLPRSPKN